LSDETHEKSLLSTAHKLEIIEATEDDLRNALALLTSINELATNINKDKLAGTHRHITSHAAAEGADSIFFHFFFLFIFFLSFSFFRTRHTQEHFAGS